MTHCILLGGNSNVNRKWLQDLAAFLNPHFASAHIHQYRHWKTGEALIDLDYELKALIKTVPADQPYIIIAKSAGVLLTLKGVADKVLTPRRCIFIGTPVRWAKAHGFTIDAWMSNYSLPTLFIQQSQDPAMSFAELQLYLLQTGNKNYQLAELPGEDHFYGDFDQLQKEIISFVS